MFLYYLPRDGGVAPITCEFPNFIRLLRELPDHYGWDEDSEDIMFMKTLQIIPHIRVKINNDNSKYHWQPCANVPVSEGGFDV